VGRQTPNKSLLLYYSALLQKSMGVPMTGAPHHVLGETPRRSQVCCRNSCKDMQALEPSAQERHGPVGVGPEKAIKMISLEKRRLQRDLLAAFRYLEGACKKDGDVFFSRACCDRARGNGFELKEGRFRLDLRNTFFYSEGGETLAQVTQRGGQCPIPGNIQGQSGRALSNLVWWKMLLLMAEGWTRWPLKVPSNPNHSVIL